MPLKDEFWNFLRTIYGRYENSIEVLEEISSLETTEFNLKECLF